MSLRKKVVYTVKPHVSKPRCHTIPVEAAREALNDPAALINSLQSRQCLVKIIVIDHGKMVARYPQMLMHPNEENELYCSEEQFPQYPAHLSDGAKLVVELVVVD